jgi:hypothetical protein
MINIRAFVHIMGVSFPTVFDCIGVRVLAACGAALGGGGGRTLRISSAIFINEFHEKKYKSY